MVATKHADYGSKDRCRSCYPHFAIAENVHGNLSSRVPESASRPTEISSGVIMTFDVKGE
jgi:hypothetical protein